MVTQLPWRFLFFLHHYLDFLLHLSNLSESLLEDKQGLGIAASGFIQGLNSEIVQTLISSPRQALNKVHTIFFIQLTRILCFVKARKVVKQCNVYMWGESWVISRRNNVSSCGGEQSLFNKHVSIKVLLSFREVAFVYSFIPGHWYHGYNV